MGSTRSASGEPFSLSTTSRTTLAACMSTSRQAHGGEGEKYLLNEHSPGSGSAMARSRRERFSITMWLGSRRQDKRRVYSTSSSRSASAKLMNERDGFSSRTWATRDRRHRKVTTCVEE